MNYIGERIKILREEHFKYNQSQFAKIINQYQEKKIAEGKKISKFKQTNISNIENGKLSFSDKITIIINYLYEEKNVNLNWLLLENNTIHPMFIFNINLDKNLNNIFDEIKTYADEIKKRTNEIQIVTLNSTTNNTMNFYDN